MLRIKAVRPNVEKGLTTTALSARTFYFFFGFCGIEKAVVWSIPDAAC
jgi:hypothetical protein